MVDGDGRGGGWRLDAEVEEREEEGQKDEEEGNSRLWVRLWMSQEHMYFSFPGFIRVA